MESFTVFFWNPKKKHLSWDRSREIENVEVCSSGPQARPSIDWGGGGGREAHIGSQRAERSTGCETGLPGWGKTFLSCQMRAVCSGLPLPAGSARRCPTRRPTESATRRPPPSPGTALSPPPPTPASQRAGWSSLGLEGEVLGGGAERLSLPNPIRKDGSTVSPPKGREYRVSPVQQPGLSNAQRPPPWSGVTFLFCVIQFLYFFVFPERSCFWLFFF